MQKQKRKVKCQLCEFEGFNLVKHYYSKHGIKNPSELGYKCIDRDSSWNAGKAWSPEVIENMKQAKQDQKYKDIAVANLGQYAQPGAVPWVKGRKLTQSQKDKISLSNIGRPKIRTVEHNKKISDAKLGYRHKHESKELMSNSAIERWADPAERERQSLVKKRQYEDKPETHPNRVIVRKYKESGGKGGYISKGHIKMYDFIKQYYQDVDLNLRLKTNKSTRYLDVGVPSLKIDFEWDEYPKHFTEEGKKADEERTKEIAEVGWETVRVNKSNFEAFKKEFKEKYKRV